MPLNRCTDSFAGWPFSLDDAMPARMAPSRGHNSVIIAFETRLIRELCEHQAAAEKEFGIEAARQLRARLSELRQAANGHDLVAGRPRKEVRSNGVKLVLDMGPQFQIVFRPNHNDNPVNPTTNTPDFSRITRVLVEAIESMETVNDRS
jgi:proteic killer suppression protein